jgi:hypothetical protein
MAHQVEHLGNPWFTRFIAAPVGAQLGYHALMPLEGFVMLPVTLAFGPSASYNLLSVLLPGLSCYAMYRAARLWLPSQTGAIAAGAFFGLASDTAWHAWYQLNLAAGALFLPLALEAAVRMRRNPRPRQAAILGVVLGASLLTDQQSAVLVAILAAVVLVPWLLMRRAPDSAAGDGSTLGWRPKVTATAVAVTVALVVASPQIIAMAAQTRSGGAAYSLQAVAKYYTTSNSYLPGLFLPSPRVVGYGLTFLTPVTYRGPIGDGIPTFGLVLSVLALLGLVVSWRRRSARMLALLWLGCAVLALGSTLRIGNHVFVPASEVWQEVRVSAVMPFTWFVQLPGLAGFREATRFGMLGLVPAALLAGAAVEWLSARSRWLLVPVLLLGLLEAGWGGDASVGAVWSGTRAPGVMRTALPALDRPIAADHSSSVVVDIPFGIRGGIPLPGEGAAFNPEDQVLATADGHPRAIAYLSRIPAPALAAIRKNAFYLGLLTLEDGQDNSPALVNAARLNARRLHIGWVLVWNQDPAVQSYLASTGFRFDYKADGVLVYRPAADTAGR